MNAEAVAMISAALFARRFEHMLRDEEGTDEKLAEHLALRAAQVVGPMMEVLLSESDPLAYFDLQELP